MYQTTKFGDIKDIIIINTNQNPKRIGRLELPKSQKKDDYYAVIKEADNELPRIYLSKGSTNEQSQVGSFIYRIKASSRDSANAQSIKEARRRYIRYNKLNVSTSNLNIYVDSN